MISASDGVKGNGVGAALLLNLSFPDSIKKAIKMQLDEEIRETQKQAETTRVSLERLDGKLNYYHCRQVDLVRVATGVSSEGFAALEKQFPKMNKEIADLEILKEEEAAYEQHRQTCLQARYRAFYVL